MNKDVYGEIKRLNFEDIIWIIFIFLSVMNIISNKLQKEYVVSDEQCYEDYANNISIVVLTILVFIYLYFFLRNYKMYNDKDNPSDVDLIKVIGSMFFIVGTLCLLYFQIHSDDNFIGSPVI